MKSRRLERIRQSILGKKKAIWTVRTSPWTTDTLLMYTIEKIYWVESNLIRPIFRMDLVACGTCGRNFNQDALTRHAPICKKNAKKKPRKQFDSQKNRLVGTEVNITDLKRKEKKVKLPVWFIGARRYNSERLLWTVSPNLKLYTN